jgi:hypothetical protein
MNGPHFSKNSGMKQPRQQVRVSARLFGVLRWKVCHQLAPPLAESSTAMSAIEHRYAARKFLGPVVQRRRPRPQLGQTGQFVDSVSNWGERLEKQRKSYIVLGQQVDTAIVAKGAKVNNAPRLAESRRWQGGGRSITCRHQQPITRPPPPLPTQLHRHLCRLLL